MNTIDCHETLPKANQLAGSFLIDAVIGYGLIGTVKRTVADYITLVRKINRHLHWPWTRPPDWIPPAVIIHQTPFRPMPP